MAFRLGHVLVNGSPVTVLFMSVALFASKTFTAEALPFKRIERDGSKYESGSGECNQLNNNTTISCKNENKKDVENQNKTDKDSGSAEHYPPDKYDRNGPLGLVPTFLVGASTVAVLYLIIHCLYLHCYAKRKMAALRNATPQPATLIMSDRHSSTSLQAVTPIVRYEGSYGKTEVVETQPFLVRDSTSGTDQSDDRNSKIEEQQTQRKRSVQFQLGGYAKEKKRRVSSATSFTESSHSESGEGGSDQTMRATICFVPVGRSFSDPSNSNVDWTALQGYVCPRFSIPNRDSITSAADNSDEVSPAVPTKQNCNGQDSACTKIPENTG